MKYLLVLIVTIGLLSSCQSRENRSMSAAKYESSSQAKDYSAKTQSAPSKEMAVGTAAALKDNAEMYNRKIIKNANCKMRVENVESSTAKIQNASAILGGFVANMDLSSTKMTYQNNMTIRIPDHNFEELYNTITKEAISVDYKRINSDDVTEQFVDIESRLKTKREVLKRYEDILRSKVKTVDEILEAEEKIRALQEEIEAKEGRLRYLSSRVDLSTLTLNIYEVREEPIVAAIQITFPDRIKEALWHGWSFIVEILILAATIWPILLLISVLLLWKRKWILAKFFV